MLLALTSISYAGRADQEHATKAALIFKFLPFIDWPSLGNPNDPFIIGVYGADDYEQTIQDTFGGQAYDGHPFVVQQLHSDGDIKGCRILFSGASSEDRVDRLASLCARSNTLLVGDANDFAKNGGTIGFVMVHAQVKFQVNLDTARRSNVTISSKLVSLAKDKFGEGGP